ncbi:endo-1,4-beta-xylanase [Streptomyces litchfieldiae]|uniref:endo-1,4-beta-xylanase n=1 Tax=Streptomyces litchfieldiae TaxID=3075543 RepID=UPI00288A3305|nr:endo-1,4-beta-xylanase [Streptomyces sp. DSM 44938]
MVLAVATALLPSGAALAGTTTAASADPVTVVSGTFEDGTTQGWAARGGETVEAGTTVAHGGTGSLAVTGRTGTWQGPILDVTDTLAEGTRYSVSVWVRLADGATPDVARLSVERRLDGAASYQTLGSAQATADGWVELTGSYLRTSEADYVGLYVETASVTAGFFIDDVIVSHVPETPIQTDIPSLKEVFTEFPLGVALSPESLYGERARLAAKHFNSVTPGNALKWDATEPREGAFQFTDADRIVQFAAENGMAVRGHTLVWHQQTPDWVFRDAAGDVMTPTPENKELLLSRLEAHIRGVAGRYGDDIGVWDVVNEVIDENQADGMRRSMWYQITGLDYIRTAFRVAHEVAPNARLFINDYNTNVPAKRDALFGLVSQLRSEGVPIHGVGHQMHVNVEWPSVAETEAMLQKFIPLGVEQQITELDVSIYTNSGESFPTPPADRLLAQAHKYREMFGLFTEYAEHITSVTVWGLDDDSTWLDGGSLGRDDAPMLFDDQLQAKSAYWAVVDPNWSGTAEPSSGCRVAYQVVNEWPGGFEGRVTVTNTSPSPLAGWNLTWSLAQGQEIARLWNGVVSRNGSAVSVRNTSWNGTLAADSAVTFGFLGSWSGANPRPTYFTLNGGACTTA